MIVRGIKMVTGDMIALGVLVTCILLATCGLFKWLIKIAVGLVFGLFLLVCISILISNPVFDKLTNGVFKEGQIIPYLREQIEPIEKLIGSESIKTGNATDENKINFGNSNATIMPLQTAKQT
jgi:hypothetical protein